MTSQNDFARRPAFRRGHPTAASRSDGDQPGTVTCPKRVTRLISPIRTVTFRAANRREQPCSPWHVYRTPNISSLLLPTAQSPSIQHCRWGAGGKAWIRLVAGNAVTWSGRICSLNS